METHHRNFIISDKLFYIKAPKTSIGRTETNVTLADDNSISRVHAHFFLNDDEDLHIRDAKSKYGTFLVNAGIATQITDVTQLKDGDVIRFGKFQNEWIVHQLQHKTAISMVDKKDKLIQILKTIKVKVSDKVDDTCTHLTIPKKASVSVKLLMALSSCTPVVTPNYWIAFQDCVTKDTVLPKSLNFLPHLEDDLFVTPGTISLAINREREKLFAGKKFVFVAKKQMETCEQLIRNAGGQACCLSQTKMTDKQCCAKHTIVIEPKAEATQSINEDAIVKIRSEFIHLALSIVLNMFSCSCS